MPLFDDGDSALLKKWVVIRLENISDADSDVLADYVLALLRHEQSEAEVRQMCIDQLDDFLREHTTPFVDQLFGALRTRSYLSVNSTLHSGLLTTTVTPHTAPAPVPQPPAAQDDADSEGSYTPKSPVIQPSQVSQQNNNSKKRGYYDRDAPGASQQQAGGHYANSRTKNPKTQGRGGNRATGNGSFDPHSKWSRGGGEFGRNGQVPGQLPRHQVPQGAFPMNMMPGGGPLPLANPQLPFGADPMTQLLAVQAVASLQGGWNPLAMFQPHPNILPAPEPRQNNRGKRGVCHSFEQKRYCRRGDACPYLHANPLVVPPAMTPQAKGQDEDEYDPHTPMLSPQDLERRASASFPPKATPQPRGGGTQRGGRGGARGGRSEFSAFGAPRDVHTKALVVESIPDDKLTEEAVHGYFATFGAIESVELRVEKKLAIVKFENQEDAKKAHSSPEPIFNNRFVKVYWMKGEGDNQQFPSQNHQQSDGKQFNQDEMEVDMEDFQRKQEEAQKAHDERAAKKKDIDDQAKKLEEMKADLLRRQEEEKRKLLAKLAKKHSAKGTANGGADTPEPSNKESKEAQQTAALKAQLEALEAEATSLGLDHSMLDEPLSEFQSSYRGRGSFRGRGGFGGYSARGAYPARGRGAYGAFRGTAPFARGRGGAGMAKKMTLDNRTKTVMVNGVSDSNIEALQHILLACGSQYTKLDKNTEVEDSHIITFNTRGDAARFFHSNPVLPEAGKIEVSWVENSVNNANNGTKGPLADAENGHDYGDSMDAEAGGHQKMENGGETGFDQYDVYDMADEEDDSRWN
ncbi:hypothetical protein TWF730_010925 [Orbilia blumenaviensis]|uniref:Uncharacterized protein n=1 Tax=Orbilia blumenaviensis TaxID=1796055 RepID=A0AAV9UML9_9PEZI